MSLKLEDIRLMVLQIYKFDIQCQVYINKFVAITNGQKLYLNLSQREVPVHMNFESFLLPSDAVDY